jgi:hypothetical protein
MAEIVEEEIVDLHHHTAPAYYDHVFKQFSVHERFPVL